MIREDRGPNDLELQIDMLTKQKEYMQRKCREAGTAVLDMQMKIDTLSKEFDRVVEENENLKTMMKK